MDNKNEKKEYLYDAFISYRHCEKDKFVAENLHKQMEAFKLPKNIEKNKNVERTKISRVFRDKDELPLTSNLEDPILKALEASEYLIVICSPRLPESIWCKKEIETFVKMHGREKVLAVLIEGEPHESFPEELLCIDEVIENEDGTKEVKKKLIEPLAADFRGETEKEMKNAMKTEILRLLAPMFGVTYDDLRQRHRERKIRRMVSLVAGIAIASLLFGGYSTYMAAKVAHQNAMIKKQTKILTENQSIALSKQAIDYLKQDDRERAIETALQSVTSQDGVELPWTPEGERALIDCVGIYDAGGSIACTRQLVADGIVNDLKVSPDGSKMITIDDNGNMIVWDFDTFTRLKTIVDDISVSEYGFIDDHTVFYHERNREIKIIDLDKDEEMAYPEEEASVDGAEITADGSSMIYYKDNEYTLLDSASMKKKGSVQKGMSEIFGGFIVDDVSEDPSMIYAQTGIEGQYVLHGFSLEDCSPVFECEMEDDFVADIVEDEECIYVTYYGYENIHSRTITCAYDKTGKMLWRIEQDSASADFVNYMVESDYKLLLVCAGNISWTINCESGELIEYIVMPQDAVMSFISETGGFLIMEADGACQLVFRDVDEVDSVVKIIDCNNISIMDRANPGYIGVPKDSDRIVCYNRRRNKDAVLYEGEIPESIEAETADTGDLEEVKTMYNLEDAALVLDYIVIPDANLTLIAYVNGKLEVYQTEGCKLLRTYDDIETTFFEYCGMAKGKYYIKGAFSGFSVDKNGNVCMNIRNFVGLSKNKKSIIVTGKDEDNVQHNYEIPIYDSADLIERSLDFLEATKISDDQAE